MAGTGSSAGKDIEVMSRDAPAIGKEERSVDLCHNLLGLTALLPYLQSSLCHCSFPKLDQ